MPNDRLNLPFLMNLWKGNGKVIDFWRSFVSAALWTIWLTKIGSTFQNERKNSREMNFLLKSTTYKLMKAKVWITKASLGLDTIWIHSPFHFLKLQDINQKDSLLELFFYKFSLIGFSDGSWYKHEPQSYSAGIGGLLYNNKMEIIFTLAF